MYNTSHPVQVLRSPPGVYSTGYASEESNTRSTAFSQSPSNNSLTPRPANTQVKFTVVGDGGVGKTCLLTVYAKNQFPTAYEPTVFENYSKQVQYRNELVDVGLWDTAGQEDYDRLRPLSYHDTSCLIICFAINSRNSLENVIDRWHPEVSHFLPGTPIILVATKIDLRKDEKTLQLLAAQGDRPISYEQGSEFARGAGMAYCEVASIRAEGVQEVFDLALQTTLHQRQVNKVLPTKRKKEKCILV